VGRFDDIWSGLTLKRACDLLGYAIYNGDPLCHHEKAPRSTFADLVNEVHGLECNEHLWEVLDEVDPWAGDAEGRPTPAGEGEGAISPANFATVYRAMGRRLADGDFAAWENGPFLNHCGEYMLDWVDCLKELHPEGLQTEIARLAVAED
jgi:hypothetical protein